MQLQSVKDYDPNVPAKPALQSKGSKKKKSGKKRRPKTAPAGGPNVTATASDVPANNNDPDGGNADFGAVDSAFDDFYAVAPTLQRPLTAREDVTVKEGVTIKEQEVRQWDVKERSYWRKERRGAKRRCSMSSDDFSRHLARFSSRCMNNSSSFASRFARGSDAGRFTHL